MIISKTRFPFEKSINDETGKLDKNITIKKEIVDTREKDYKKPVKTSK